MFAESIGLWFKDYNIVGVLPWAMDEGEKQARHDWANERNKTEIDAYVKALEAMA